MMKMQCQETVMQCQEKIAFPKEEARRHNSCRPCVSDCSQECNGSFARVYKAAGMRKVVWSGEEWAAADERRRRVHADATLAASAAHMAGPLLTSKHLQVLDCLACP